MTDELPETMRELFEEHGYDTEELAHPRDVTPDDLDDESRVVAYTCVENPDPDAPRTTWDVVEWEIEDVVPTDEMYDHTDGAISYADETSVTHGVIWSYKLGHLPNVVSIGYGDGMYGPDSDFEDPMRWDRSVRHVLGLSDDFTYFKL